MLLVGNDKEIIQDLKTQFSSKSDMKKLGAASYILGMEIKIDWKQRKFWLNQRKYVETILQRFNMQDSKPMKVPIPVGVQLSIEQCPKTQEEEEDMSRVPYASARLCSSMGLVHEAIRIDCDSQSAIFLAKNLAYHSKTKQIDVQYHFVRDMIEDKNVLLVKVDTLKNTAAALTKSMSSEKFSRCRETMGVSRLEK
eukprot:PITA_02144